MAYIVTDFMPLKMPVPGTREPAQISLINENMTLLSGHDHSSGEGLPVSVLRSGLAANRPSAAEAGGFWFATDTALASLDTGTAWVDFLTSGAQGQNLRDPIVRDAIRFGPEGSTNIDATLQNAGGGGLSLNGSPVLTQALGDARYLATATVMVSSVNGMTGAVTLTAADVGALTQGAGDSRYVNVSGDSLTGDLAIKGKYVVASTDAGNILEWRANGFYVPVTGSGGGGAPTDVTIIGDDSITVAEDVPELFNIGVTVSPDVGNALVLRPSGLYATDTVNETGISQGDADLRYVNFTGDQMTGNLSWGATVGTPDAYIGRTGPNNLLIERNLGLSLSVPNDLHSARRALRIGDSGLLAGGTAYNALELRVNSYLNASNNPVPLVASQPAGILSLVSETLTYQTAAPVALGATQTFNTRLQIEATGRVMISPAPGTAGIYISSQAAGNVTPQPNIMLSRQTPASHGQWIEFQNGAAQGDYLIGRKPNDDALYLTAWNGSQMLDRVRFQFDGTVVLGNSNQSSGAILFNAGGVNEQRYMLSTAFQDDLTIQDQIRGGSTPFRLSRVTNTVTLAPNPSQPALTLVASPSGIITSANTLILKSAANMHVNPTGTIFGPETDGTINLGYSSVRWAQIWSTIASISTSHVSLKHGFARLDPAACVQAVADTDWLSFTYNDPPMAPSFVPEDDPEREQKDADARAAYEKMVAETAASRKHNGYVLGSDEYKTADLFGMADRYSASTGADLAVVACALQDIIRRLTELESKSA